VDCARPGLVVLPLGAGGSLFALVCGYQPGLVAFELESEREQFTAETIRYERDRIARELHDVIAHSVSIIVIQASAGQRLPPGDPGSGELLGNIAELAREAAADISGLTGLLTPVLEHPLMREHIEDLLARTAQTGVQLDFDIVGDVSSIPGHTARATYRILQEGLTNALRHAPGAAIWVSMTCDDGVRLEIVNDSPPAGAVGIGQLGTGHGLTGLIERTATLGGSIHSGPVPVGGWRLSAELPATAGTFGAHEGVSPEGGAESDLGVAW
jgi:signal transduction histidine kinase